MYLNLKRNIGGGVPPPERKVFRKILDFYIKNRGGDATLLMKYLNYPQCGATTRIELKIKAPYIIQGIQ